LVDGGDDFLDVFLFRGGLAKSDLAVEVPEIDPFRERFAAFAFQVLADVVFDGFHDASGLVVG
jgi:hypothetical protein